MHKKIFMPVLCAAVLPMLVTAAAICVFVFGIGGKNVDIPQARAYSCYSKGLYVAGASGGRGGAELRLVSPRKVILVISVSTPLILLIILFFVYRITHQIIGPFDRIISEMGECLEGTRTGDIRIRTNDRIAPIVSRINKLLDRYRL